MFLQGANVVILQCSLSWTACKVILGDLFWSPWVIHGEAGSFRGNAETIPLMSLGQFVNVIEGVVMVITWPGTAITERGSDMASGTQFLFKELSQQPAFDKFMQHAAQWVTLAEGQSFWIPYGWRYALVTRFNLTSPVSSTSLIAPAVTQAMTKKMPRALVTRSACSCRIFCTR